ncbi:MAG TPA: PKD domain-containing protein [Candidatus Polarisedimenticolaceae bacterium]|nr:PKD domain-containing protein [Candidatus Polarisedimenticolaceae bacterium]
MSKATRLGWGASLLGILLVAAIACEDSAVIAPSDGSITVTLNPTAVTVDPNVPANAEKSSDVRALVLDKDGKPVENSIVYFSSTGGRLVQPGSSPEVSLDSAATDSQGIARATLVVTAEDADEVDVTALSGALTNTATLTKNVVGEQRPPTASLTIEPCGDPCAGEVNRVVTFKSTSTDPNDSDVLTFRWSIVSTGASGSEQFVTQSTRFSRTYTSAQDLAVSLEVSDDPAALSSPTTPGIWDDSAAKDYKICANQAPVAVAATGTLPTGAYPRAVPVDGSGSSDPDDDPLTFTWACGNGTTATGRTTFCNYTAAGSFTITLTVNDNPSGCPKKSGIDTVGVTLAPVP